MASPRADASASYSFGGIVVIGSGQVADRLTTYLDGDGFDVEAVAAFDAAKALLREGFPDVVVLASAQPEGVLTMCSWIRVRSNVPIAVIAPPSNGVDPARALDAGADTVIGTRFGRHELIARVRAVLRRAPAAPGRGRGGSVGWAGLQLDRDRQIVTVGSADIELDDREFGLLEALMTSGSKVVSRSGLRTRLAVGDAELDGCVRRLRNLLEAEEGWRRVVNQRGVGFRLLESPAVAPEPPALEMTVTSRLGTSVVPAPAWAPPTEGSDEDEEDRALSLAGC